MNLSLTEILAIISPVVSVAVSCGVINEKIKQLEKTVDKHNKFAERIPVIENRISNVEKEVQDIKEDLRGE